MRKAYWAGKRMTVLNAVPPWGSVRSASSSSMRPPSASKKPLTASIPTPRPDTEVTAAAVEKPEAKINCANCWAGSSLEVLIRPFSRAFWAIASKFRPAPSSLKISSRCCSSNEAASSMRPAADLLRSVRSAVLSMPWSRALR